RRNGGQRQSDCVVHGPPGLHGLELAGADAGLETTRTEVAPIEFEIAQVAQEPAALIARHSRTALRVIVTARFAFRRERFRQSADTGAFNGRKYRHQHALPASGAANTFLTVPRLGPNRQRALAAADRLNRHLTSRRSPAYRRCDRAARAFPGRSRP